MFRDHFLLSQIFWPHYSRNVNQEATTQHNTSCFTVEMPDTHGTNVFKVALCDHESGVICTEKMGLGGKVTNIYTVVEREKRLYLVEEVSVTTVKLLIPFLQHGEGPIVKTKNLLQMLENTGAGMEASSALSQLNGGMVCETDSDLKEQTSKNR